METGCASSQRTVPGLPGQARQQHRDGGRSVAGHRQFVVAFAPLKPTEFVMINIAQLAGQSARSAAFAVQRTLGITAHAAMHISRFAVSKLFARTQRRSKRCPVSAGPLSVFQWRTRWGPTSNEAKQRPICLKSLVGREGRDTATANIITINGLSSAQTSFVMRFVPRLQDQILGGFSAARGLCAPTPHRDRAFIETSASVSVKWPTLEIFASASGPGNEPSKLNTRVRFPLPAPTLS